MSQTLYSKKILELTAHIPRIGRLEKPDGTATCHAKLCGSEITVDVKVRDEIVIDFAHDVKACALGQAAASFLAQHVIGKSYRELRALQITMHEMLESDGTPPTGEWADLALFETVKPYKTRHASTLLTFDATVAAIEKALDKA